MQAWSKWRVTEYLKPDEVEALISLVSSEGDRLLLRALWESGGRPGEVVRLTPEYIDSKNNCLILQNFKQNKRKNPSDPKSPHPLKRVYLFPESTLCADLMQYCRDSHIYTGEWVFPSRTNLSKPFSTVTLWRIVTHLSAELGIRYIKKDTRTGEYMNKPAWPNLARHGAAHAMLARTGRIDVVQSQLGHASIATTQIYASLTGEEVRKIVQGVPATEE